MSAPTSTHTPVNVNESTPEITASVEASGLPITHMHSSNTPHRLSARLVFSGCPLSRWVQRLRFIAPHGGIAAMNGTMQNSTHSGACEVIAVTSENAAIAEHRAGDGQRDGLHGGQRARQRIVAVVMLHGDRDRHADHRERHAGDDRADGVPCGVGYAQKLGVPAEHATADILDAGDDRIGHNRLSSND